jgi:hypothetical protein
VILSVFVHDAPAVGPAIARGVTAEAMITRERANRRTRTRSHEDSFDSDRSLNRPLAAARTTDISRYRDGAMGLSDEVANLFDVDFLDWLFGVVDGGSGRGRRLPRKGIVPDVRGFDVAAARDVLHSEGFQAVVKQLEPHPAPVMGVVVDQAPRPDVRWNRARPVRIDVSHPPAVQRDAG